MRHSDSTEGEVTEALKGVDFRVKIGEKIVIAYVCGKMNRNKIRVLPGDRVLVSLSPAGDRGIITRRL